MVTVVTVVTLSSDDHDKQSAIFLLGLYHLYVYIQVSFSLFFCHLTLQVYGSEGLWTGVNEALQILGGTYRIL